MKKVLVISEAIFLNLYRPGLEDYSDSHDDMEIDFYCLDVPKKELNPLERVAYKRDIGNFRKKYYERQREEVVKLVEQYDTILFLSLFYDQEYFVQGKLAELVKQKNSIVYFMDSIKTVPCKIPFLNIFKKVYVFEEQDVDFVQKEYGITAELVPIGTSYYLFEDNIKGQSEKKYDLCFVGLATPKRIEYLDEIARWCFENNKTFFVAGHFWHTNNKINYWIGKMKFKIKHPILAKYVQNKFIQPYDLAAVYTKSRIVLNINVAYHKSLNQRTFDILFCNSLLICDKQNVGSIEITPGQDFIMCDGIEEMVDKISYYLEHDEERERISARGRALVAGKYLYAQTLKKIFS